MLSHRCIIVSALATALMSTTVGADAATLKKIEWQYYAYGSAYDGNGSPTTCELKNNNCGAFIGYFNVVPAPGSITFDYSASSGGAWTKSVLSLPPTIHNGVAINLLSGGTITAVKIDPATNMVGFNKRRVSFTAKQIQVDWQKLSFTSSTIVKLDVRVESAAPAGTMTGNPPRLLNAK